MADDWLIVPALVCMVSWFRIWYRMSGRESEMCDFGCVVGGLSWVNMDGMDKYR